MDGATLIHDKRCNYKHMRGVQCLILVKATTVYLVLFTDKLDMTHIIRVMDDKETTLWVSPDVMI